MPKAAVRGLTRPVIAVLLNLGALPLCAEPQAQYLTGGPLAGLDLPLFAGQYGEEPGFPGSIPGLMAQGEVSEDMGNEYREWGPQGQAPEVELHSGSVEHFRAYMGKYMPLRSFWDRQSQLENWVAPDLPGAEGGRIEQYAEPVFWVPRHSSPRPTGRTRRPVPVVRMKIDTPLLRLDLGTLPIGLYVIRVIGAVEPSRVRPFREPLYMRLVINDGLAGEVNRYRRRLGYCEQFYSVAEFYFHAAEQRRYRAELAVDRGSTADLLVHNVSLDDMLAGMERRPLKTRCTTEAPVELASAAPNSPEARLARDAALWNGFPPINSQGSGIGTGFGGYGAIKGVSAGTDELTGEEIEEQFGKWVPWGRDTRGMALPEGVADTDVFLANPKLGLVYAHDDLRAGRPLPDPYPAKDDGAGLYFPDPNDPAVGRAWTPIGARVHQLNVDYYNGIGRSIQQCDKDGSYEAAHDAAVQLIRFAYAFPTLDFAEYLHSTVRESGPFGRDYSCRRRATAAYFLPHYPLYVKPIASHYDRLFEFIEGNKLLAQSVGRFVPWVKTPDDVIELLDTHLVQTVAKRILRYHYHTNPMDIANLAAVVGDRSVTDPWMEWLFSRTFIYPLPVAGIQDTMITGTTREGTEFVGSTYYAQGEGASRVAAALDRYLAAGGNPKYDLSDRARYPKPVAHAYWRMENVVAGQDFLRIGDVCGPDKAPGHTLRDLGFARAGWRWTHDPRFAFILHHYVGGDNLPVDEWTAIRQASVECPRAPWLDNRSRVLPMWAGVLEAGTEHDDFRFRRAAYLRVGYGMGHQHSDTLDLQVVAHGLPMTIDGGQRPGYSSPADRTTRIHNTVEVDGNGHRNHSWVTVLADHEGARYLSAAAAPPPGATAFRRQIALLDVDDDDLSQPLTPGEQAPFTALPKGVVTPNSYVFDVVSVAGGKQHTYCFHGPLHDDFQWNAQNVVAPAEGTDDAQYLAMFKRKPELSFAGDAPPLFRATWRMAAEVEGSGMGEKEMLGKSYDPDAPRKFTRLHLLGTDGARAMRGQFVCTRWNYDFTNVMVQRRAAEGEDLDGVFAAIIEPFAGEPFIDSVRQVPVSGGGDSARTAVAVQVTTTAGRVDLCFASGRPAQVSHLLQKQMRVAGEHAFVSRDQKGLRQATLVGGTLLDSPSVRIEMAAPLREARVIKADYLQKKLWIDQRWPRFSQPVAIEVGLDDPEHKTTYTVTGVEPTDDGSVLTLQRGADYYRSAIEEVRADGTVQCALKPLLEYVTGDRKGWVASNGDRTRFWRAEYLGNRTFKLTGAPVTEDAFGDPRVLRLWECGVGDTVRQRVSASLRRVAKGKFALTTDTDLKLSLPARTIELSTDGQTWTALDVRPASGFAEASIPLGERQAHSTVLLRIR